MTRRFITILARIALDLRKREREREENSSFLVAAAFAPTFQFRHPLTTISLWGNGRKEGRKKGEGGWRRESRSGWKMELQTKEQASRSSRLSGIVGRVYFCSRASHPLGYAKISAIIVMQTGRWIMQRAKFIRAALAHFCPPTSSLYQIILWPVLIINKPRSRLCALQPMYPMWPLRLFLPLVQLLILVARPWSSSGNLRVKVGVFFFFFEGRKGWDASCWALEGCSFFFRCKIRDEIMSRNERERDLMVA